MRNGITPITFIGNLASDPELRYTKNGAPVAAVRVASTPRRYDKETGQYVDGEATFLTCNVWQKQAEHVANSLNKGDRVVVEGTLHQRSWEDKNGNRRYAQEIEVHEIGASMLFNEVEIRKPHGGQQRTSQGVPESPANTRSETGFPAGDEPPF
ncbi:single-stranded DNA-binding protein [Corynebacterium macclintockiae]|uniref:single-stranded DNA-binding protein n=1 Tax=Corynebacterium macclintockiae TaxID=2913501 RepID=UPI0005B3D67C